MIHILACVFAIANSKLTRVTDREQLGKQVALPTSPIPIEEITVCGGKSGVKGFTVSGLKDNGGTWKETNGMACEVTRKNTVRLSKFNLDQTDTDSTLVVDEIAFGYDKYLNIMYIEVAYRGGAPAKLIGTKNYVKEVHSEPIRRGENLV